MNKVKRELYNVLRKAVANREQHNLPQQEYFTPGIEDAPFFNYECNTACCIAGDKVLRDMIKEYGSDTVARMFPGTPIIYSSQMLRIAQDAGIDAEWVYHLDNAWDYAAIRYDLDYVMAHLVINPCTHYRLHEFVMQALEKGKQFPPYPQIRKALGRISSLDGTYMEFNHVTLGGRTFTDLDELIEHLGQFLIDVPDEESVNWWNTLHSSEDNL